tara:strand:- start:61398 stop:62267 length:870 start_codon:yes stop_codon:yes gene_type:complete
MSAAHSATKATPDDLTVTPRNIHFETQTADGRAWLGGDPVGTAVFNALSLTFPDGERLFMDAVRHYRGELSGKLLEDAKAFIAQEAIHSREHVALNSVLDRSHYPVDEIEDELRRRLTFARSRGPMAMLAITIVLEHFTAMMADQLLKGNTALDGAPEEIIRLWQWHAMEETEHKAVAFDVFQVATRDWSNGQRYRLRARVMMIATIMFSTNITRYAAKLLAADGMNIWAARLRVLRYLFLAPGLFRKSWTSYWDWFRPGFHPWDHDNRATIEAWREQFTPDASEASPA